jgi:hypothetical protein
VLFFCWLSWPFTLVMQSGGRLTCTVIVAIRTACSVFDVVCLWRDMAIVL